MANGELTLEQIRKYQQTLQSDPGFKLAMNAVTRGNLQEIAVNREVLNDANYSFTHEIENKAAITDQKRSGTCWMYAELNWLRTISQKKLNVEGMNFSHNYVMFWDKFEKANFFLERVIEMIDRDLDDRRLHHLLKHPIGDGGEWGLLRNVITKYGLVPTSAMPDTSSKENSRFLNEILGYKLREYASVLRKMHQSGKSTDQIRNRKRKFLEEIFRIMVIFMGMPPERLTWSYRDKDKGYHQMTDVTPQEFFEQAVGVNMDEVYCLGYSPLEETPYEQTFTQDLFNNAVDGRPWVWLNLPRQELKKYALKMLKDGDAVLFGSDVLQDCHSKEGILHHDIFNYDTVFNTRFTMDRATRMLYGQSFYTHCMVFSGVEYVNGKPVRWKVENSWGTEVGNKGYFIMSDKWFDEHIYDVVIPRKYIRDEHLEMFEKPPVLLPPWHAF